MEKFPLDHFDTYHFTSAETAVFGDAWCPVQLYATVVFTVTSYVEALYVDMVIRMYIMHVHLFHKCA